MPKYTKEQFWKLYEKLPQELKDILFAEETGEAIYNACVENGVRENLSKVVDIVGQVLLGLLAPEDFQKALETEISIDQETSKKITSRINRFVFFPVKESLAALYEIKTTKPVKTVPASPIEEVRRPVKKLAERKGPDAYREPVE